jgi:hypothetical protein
MKALQQTPEEVSHLVDQEIRTITNEPAKAALLQALVRPYLQMRKWDYSPLHELLPCWVVAEFRGTGLGLAYSPDGHGRRGDCWGVVELTGEWFGRDDSWFLTLEDAFINSAQYQGPLPEDYEIR